MNPSTWILGVDMGGTRTRVALAGLEGAITRVEEAGPGNPVRVGPVRAMQSLREALGRALADLPRPARIAACCVGMAGRSHPGAAGVIRSGFAEAPAPERRILRDDGTIALQAAFGDQPGVLVMAGTGSGAVARGAAGIRRAGGWGPVFGDEGSAHAIGVAALRAIARAEDARGPGTHLRERVAAALGETELRRLPLLAAEGRIDFPALCPLVVESAAAGDAAALGILEDAGTELAVLARGAARLASVPPPAAVATSGSLLGGSGLLRAALARALAGGPESLRAGPHVESPVSGAVGLALAAHRAGGPPEQDW